MVTTEILAEVYAELTGGKQSSLTLGAFGSDTGNESKAAVEARAARQVLALPDIKLLSTEEIEKHRAFIAEMDAKQRLYGVRYPLDEDFLAALATMPEASGVALGFDRLAMLTLGARHINEVIWTPFPV